MAITETHLTHEINHPAKYTFEKVILTLVVITIIEVLVSLDFPENLRALQITILMILAIIKAALVVAFFMHVKYEKRPLALTLMIFGFPLSLSIPLVVLTVYDYLFYY